MSARGVDALIKYKTNEATNKAASIELPRDISITSFCSFSSNLSEFSVDTCPVTNFTPKLENCNNFGDLGPKVKEVIQQSSPESFINVPLSCPGKVMNTNDGFFKRLSTLMKSENNITFAPEGKRGAY